MSELIIAAILLIARSIVAGTILLITGRQLKNEFLRMYTNKYKRKLQ